MVAHATPMANAAIDAPIKSANHCDGRSVFGASLQDVHALGSAETESCSVQLTAMRSHSGSIDPAFTEGGENVAYQARAQLFTSMP